MSQLSAPCCSALILCFHKIENLETKWLLELIPVSQRQKHGEQVGNGRAARPLQNAREDKDDQALTTVCVTAHSVKPFLTLMMLYIWECSYHCGQAFAIIQASSPCESPCASKGAQLAAPLLHSDLRFPERSGRLFTRRPLPLKLMRRKKPH